MIVSCTDNNRISKYIKKKIKKKKKTQQQHQQAMSVLIKIN